MQLVAGENTIRGVTRIGSDNSRVTASEFELSKKYSISFRQEIGNQYLRVNTSYYSENYNGEYIAPISNTVFAIGTNPTGEMQSEDGTIGLAASQQLSNIEVFSVRIYNKCLTEEEVIKNYDVDRFRFGINN